MLPFPDRLPQVRLGVLARADVGVPGRRLVRDRRGHWAAQALPRPWGLVRVGQVVRHRVWGGLAVVAVSLSAAVVFAGRAGWPVPPVVADPVRAPPVAAVAAVASAVAASAANGGRDVDRGKPLALRHVAAAPTPVRASPDMPLPILPASGVHASPVLPPNAAAAEAASTVVHDDGATPRAAASPADLPAVPAPPVRGPSRAPPAAATRPDTRTPPRAVASTTRRRGDPPRSAPTDDADDIPHADAPRPVPWTRPDLLVAIPDAHTVVVHGARGLPEGVRVGDRLPSGATLLHVDRSAGTARTDRGLLRLE